MTTTASRTATEPDELGVDRDIDFTPQAGATIARLDQLTAATQRRRRERAAGRRAAR